MSDLPTSLSFKGLVWCLGWPRGVGAYTNSSTGISMFFSRRRFSARSFRLIWCLPAAYGGGLAAVRCKSEVFDITVVGGYVLVEPENAAGREVCQKVWNLLEQFVQVIPSRSLPLVLLDANGHVGMEKVTSTVRSLRSTVDEAPFGNSGSHGALVVEAESLDKKVRKHEKRDWREHRGLLVVQLAEAWERRDFSECHRLARAVTGRGLGPKRRMLRLPPVE